MYGISDNGAVAFLMSISLYGVLRIFTGKFPRSEIIGSEENHIKYFFYKYCQTALQNVPNEALRLELKSSVKELRKSMDGYGSLVTISAKQRTEMIM